MNAPDIKYVIKPGIMGAASGKGYGVGGMNTLNTKYVIKPGITAQEV